MNCKNCAQPIIGEPWPVEDIDGTHIYCGDCSTPYGVHHDAAIQRMINANRLCGYDEGILGVNPCVRKTEITVTLLDGTERRRCKHHPHRKAGVEAA